ncbi:hypothetical protein C7459_11683 [Tumebacillus permanentifrigoris]|uniref:Uncharacterized protein n=1 Tax=Tumebacillus permanentifrigoris TaxID=378543 RepID=A0A316D666_9BACL|nr:hypothetical protein C7459_11683 [Tumebacillus permanentifrigoris]
MPIMKNPSVDFVPSVITGNLAKEISSEINRPAGGRQVAALKKAMNNRVASGKRIK